MNEVVAKLIERFDLRPHLEGGWFRETWRAASGEGSRGAGTAILYLIQPGQEPRWNRGDATEVWLWHAGDCLVLTTSVSATGVVERTRLGMNVEAGEIPQAIVPAGSWQAAELSADATHGYCLLSCVAAPAFDFATYEIAPAGWSPPGGSAA